MNTKPTPDPIGMAAAAAAQEANKGSTIVLFGSRARGDNRPDSDVDLLIVCQDKAVVVEAKARTAIKNYFRDNPPRLPVDIVTFTEDEFRKKSTAPNHVTGQAIRDGIVMTGERLDPSTNYEGKYPPSWPDVRERLRATYRNLRAFDLNFSMLQEDQETWAYHAQQAVENSLKAWLSAAGIEYRWIHELEEPSEAIFQHHVESSTLAAHQLKSLLDTTNYQDPAEPGQTLNWLDKYSVSYKYSGTAHRMNDEEKQRFRQEILLAVHSFANRAFELTGTSESDL